MSRRPAPIPLTAAPLILAALALSLAACQDSGPGQEWQGYVEGEYLLLAPEEAGRIDAVFVRKGDRVESGAPLFEMQTTGLEARRDAASARLAQAEAQLEDLLTSAKRPEEIAVIAATIAEAEATLREAELEYERQRRLVERDFASQSARDAALAARDRATARLAALNNELEVALMPARSADIVAAERNVEAARAALDEMAWRLGEASVAAPKAGLIEQVVRRPGEAAGPANPVISLLPPENRKVRFFVPETARAALRIGQPVEIGCDACPEGLTGTVAFIATEAEYTPPVIYSQESRDKLVYLVEALPVGGAVALAPGQPVDVRLAETDR